MLESCQIDGGFVNGRVEAVRFVEGRMFMYALKLKRACGIKYKEMEEPMVPRRNTETFSMLCQG